MLVAPSLSTFAADVQYGLYQDIMAIINFGKKDLHDEKYFKEFFF